MILPDFFQWAVKAAAYVRGRGLDIVLVINQGPAQALFYCHLTKIPVALLTITIEMNRKKKRISMALLADPDYEKKIRVSKMDIAKH